MNPVRDAFIIIGLIIGLAIVVVLIRTSGGFTAGFPSPSIPTVQTTQTSPRSQTTEREKTPQQLERERQQEIRRIENEIERAQAEIAFIEEEIERIETYGENSPYKDKVTLKVSRSILAKEAPDAEYITLQASSRNEKPITISGWRLESGITGRSVAIPEAAHLLFSGTEAAELPVTLFPGDSGYINTGRSPIGESFRVNMCSGFYTQFQSFTPRLRTQCPDPETEIYDFYTKDRNIFLQDQCLDYIERMRSCEVVTKPLPITMDPSCKEAIIEEVNYNACVDHHKNDEEFYRPEWRIFLKRDTDLWRDKRELIKLLDSDGKTVDYYSY